jgi:hypothetical protein
VFSSPGNGRYLQALLEIANRKSKIEHPTAGVAELADAPDLGFQNHRFQKHSFSFQETLDLREENAIFHDQQYVHDGRVETSSF